MTKSRNFQGSLTTLIHEVYPDLDKSALAQAVVDAFWPEGAKPRKRGRAPSNNLWTEKDALLITYGNSMIDGTHKPLDLR